MRGIVCGSGETRGDGKMRDTSSSRTAVRRTRRVTFCLNRGGAGTARWEGHDGRVKTRRVTRARRGARRRDRHEVGGSICSRETLTWWGIGGWRQCFFNIISSNHALRFVTPVSSHRR